MSKPLMVSLVIVGVVIFVLGGGAGIFYQIQKEQQNIPQSNEAELAIMKTLTSKVIPSMTAFGEVTNIVGRNITLKYAGESLTIKIDDNAQIFSLTTTSPASSSGKTTVVAPTQIKVEFKDIKIGDKLNVSLKLLPSGVLKGISVMIINFPTNTNVNTK